MRQANDLIERAVAHATRGRERRNCGGGGCQIDEVALYL